MSTGQSYLGKGETTTPPGKNDSAIESSVKNEGPTVGNSGLITEGTTPDPTSNISQQTANESLFEQALLNPLLSEEDKQILLDMRTRRGAPFDILATTARMFMRSARTTALYPDRPDKPYELEAPAPEQKPVILSPFQRIRLMSEAPVFQDNEEECTDVPQLQQWIRELKTTGGDLLAFLRNDEIIVMGLEEQISLYKEMLDNRTGQVNALEEGIKQLQSIINEHEHTAKAVEVPRNSSVVKLLLDCSTSQGTSEVELVRRALNDFREARLDSGLKNIRDGESDSAFYEFSDFEKVQDILDELSDALTDAVENNNLAALFKNHPRLYAERKEYNNQQLERNMLAFAKRYGPADTSDEETPEPEASSTPEPTIEPEPEPEYMQGLSSYDKRLLKQWKEEGYSDERLAANAAIFRGDDAFTIPRWEGPVPEYLSTLTEVELDIMAGFKAKGLNDEGMARMAQWLWPREVKTTPDTGSIPAVESATSTDQPTPAEQ